MATTINSLIKAPVAQVFRRAYIKRRDATTGQFESDWYEISRDVKTWGKIVNQIDSSRRNKFVFGNAKMTLQNEEGLYNPAEFSSSLWNGYLNQQRTLVKIEAGYLKPTKIDGIWRVTEYPMESVNWDEVLWDADNALWDGTGVSPTVFTGVISGDILLSDKNEVTLNIKPLVSVFQDYAARNLTGWTSTGFTASQFVTLLRDQTDGAGNFVFRPFFGNTTSSWDISTTSTVFSNLNTSTAADVIDKTAWEIVEKLAEVENFVPYVSRDGTFKFVSRDSEASGGSAFEFHGAGSFSGEYGQTIKSVDSFGFKISKYYSRVQIKWRSEDTSSAYEVIEATLTVSGASNPWVLGVRTLAIENLYIPTSTVANALAQNIFDDVSSARRELEFTTTFVPHLDLFDRFSVVYDPGTVVENTLWDQNTWAADSTDTSSDLVFDEGYGDALVLAGEQFKFLSFEIDLDNFQNKFLAREV